MFRKIMDKIFPKLSTRGRVGKKSVSDKQKCAEILAKMDEVMIKKSLYLDMTLSLKKVSTEAGTNRTYITRALKHKGINFVAYVNTFRIVKALQILSDKKNKDLSMYEVADLSGFPSVRVLNHFLTQTLGITASVLRRRYIILTAAQEKGKGKRKPGSV